MFSGALCVFRGWISLGVRSYTDLWIFLSLLLLGFHQLGKNSICFFFLRMILLDRIDAVSDIIEEFNPFSPCIDCEIYARFM